MKILYVASGISIATPHGGSVHVAELSDALRRRGHDVRVIARGAPGEDAWSPLAFHRFLDWAAIRTIRRVAKAWRPDVVIERFYTFGGGGLVAAHQLGIPAVLEINSPAREMPGLLRDQLDRCTLLRPIERWRRMQLSLASGFYATSSLLVPPELAHRLRVVFNGVDVERFKPGEPSAVGPLRCVFASSFQSWHGADDLVVAVSQTPGIEVTMLGDGPGRAAAESRARELGLGGRMRFAGSVSHDAVPAILREAEVGLAPFRPSGHPALAIGWFWSPIKLFEYLASGLVVVTADIPELRLLLGEEVARFHVPGDPASLAAELRWLAENRGEARRMGQAGRQLATERFTWDQQAVAVEETLRAVVEGG